MRNDVKVLLASQNLYVRIAIRVATFDTNCVGSTQKVAPSGRKLPDSAVHSVNSSTLTVDKSRETI